MYCRHKRDKAASLFCQVNVRILESICISAFAGYNPGKNHFNNDANDNFCDGT